MDKRRRITIGVVAALALGAGAAGIAQAVGGEDDERVTGAAADRAARAAVDVAGGGRATEVERNDDGGSGWEVEVRRADGTQVEVHLDDALEPTGSKRDDDGEREGDDRD